ncbi:hypothetical protein [Pokkaliibacter plantistimulans]|uniref:hypothetical protein n=1 Tax=Pokkaliibacter plantistimulans TaxID=1635171 RepID=UPI001402AF8D|nr:hypothetical protein [Pokkaliibacter plantistimulans]
MSKKPLPKNGNGTRQPYRVALPVGNHPQICQVVRALYKREAGDSSVIPGA